MTKSVLVYQVGVSVCVRVCVYVYMFCSFVV